MRQYVDYLKNIIKITKIFIRKKRSHEFIGSLLKHVKCLEFLEVKLPHLWQTLCTTPLLLPHTLKIAIASNLKVSPTVIQILINLSWFFTMSEGSKHTVSWLNYRTFQWRLFHKMRSCCCIQNRNFFTKSVYFLYMLLSFYILPFEA